MAGKTIITCAVTGGSADSPGKSPHVPVTPEEIARSALEAAAAGAAIAHIHVREPGTGKPSMELGLYREVVERIRASGSDVLINLTTGAGGRFVPGEADPRVAGPGTTLASPAARVVHVESLRPPICSLDVATMNFGQHVFMNSPAHLRAMAQAIRAAGAKPELEVFEAGHLRLAKQLIAEGLIAAPPLFQLCLGIPWGAPATAETMLYLSRQVPEGAHWAAFGIGPAQFPMVAQAVILGGHVRVGLEDNLYLERGVLAPGNGPLVERAAQIIRLLGGSVATPAEARAILGLTA